MYFYVVVFPLGMLGGASHVNHALYLKLLAHGPQWGKDLEKEGTSRRSRSGDGDSARSQLIQIFRLLRAPLPVHDSLDSFGNRPSISPKPSEHLYPRPNPSQQEWLSLSPETFFFLDYSGIKESYMEYRIYQILWENIWEFTCFDVYMLSTIVVR